MSVFALPPKESDMSCVSTEFLRKKENH